MQHSRDRGSFDLALAIVRSDDMRQRAMIKFEGQKLSATTTPVYASHSRAIAQLMREAGEPLLPMPRGKLNLIGGVLKKAGYRSTRAYLEQFRREHIESGYPHSEALRLEFRSSRRGLGPRRRAGAAHTRALVDNAACRPTSVRSASSQSRS